MQLTSAQIFHHHWANALAVQDVTTLRGLYHPNAVQLFVGTGETRVGAEVIGARYAELFSIVGGITTTRVETFTDLGTAYVAETHQSSGVAQAFGYDVFVLDGGRAQYHVSGSIAPRSPALELPTDTGTPGQTHFRRAWEATHTRNLAAYAQLHAPDAVQASSGTVLRGRDAIMQSAQQGLNIGTNPRLKYLTAFVEGPGVFATEEATTVDLQDTRWDLDTHSVTVLREGKVVLGFDGLINPRAEELARDVQQVGHARVQAMQSVTYGLARFMNPWW